MASPLDLVISPVDRSEQDDSSEPCTAIGWLTRSPLSETIAGGIRGGIGNARAGSHTRYLRGIGRCRLAGDRARRSRNRRCGRLAVPVVVGWPAVCDRLAHASRGLGFLRGGTDVRRLRRDRPERKQRQAHPRGGHGVPRRRLRRRDLRVGSAGRLLPLGGLELGRLHDRRGDGALRAGVPQARHRGDDRARRPCAGRGRDLPEPDQRLRQGAGRDHRLGAGDDARPRRPECELLRPRRHRDAAARGGRRSERTVEDPRGARRPDRGARDHGRPAVRLPEARDLPGRRLGERHDPRARSTPCSSCCTGPTSSCRRSRG